MDNRERDNLHLAIGLSNIISNKPLSLSALLCIASVFRRLMHSVLLRSDRYDCFNNTSSVLEQATEDSNINDVISIAVSCSYIIIEFLFSFHLLYICLA